MAHLFNLHHHSVGCPCDAPLPHITSKEAQMKPWMKETKEGGFVTFKCQVKDCSQPPYGVGCKWASYNGNESKGEKGASRKPMTAHVNGHINQHNQGRHQNVDKHHRQPIVPPLKAAPQPFHNGHSKANYRGPLATNYLSLSQPLSPHSSLTFPQSNSHGQAVYSSSSSPDVIAVHNQSLAHATSPLSTPDGHINYHNSSLPQPSDWMKPSSPELRPRSSELRWKEGWQLERTLSRCSFPDLSSTSPSTTKTPPLTSTLTLDELTGVDSRAHPPFWPDVSAQSTQTCHSTSISSTGFPSLASQERQRPLHLIAGEGEPHQGGDPWDERQPTDVVAPVTDLSPSPKPSSIQPSSNLQRPGLAFLRSKLLSAGLSQRPSVLCFQMPSSLLAETKRFQSALLGLLPENTSDIIDECLGFTQLMDFRCLSRFLRREMEAAALRWMERNLPKTVLRERAEAAYKGHWYSVTDNTADSDFGRSSSDSDSESQSSFSGDEMMDETRGFHDRTKLKDVESGSSSFARRFETACFALTVSTVDVAFRRHDAVWLRGMLARWRFINSCDDTKKCIITLKYAERAYNLDWYRAVSSSPDWDVNALYVKVIDLAGHMLRLFGHADLIHNDVNERWGFEGTRIFAALEKADRMAAKRVEISRQGLPLFPRLPSAVLLHAILSFFDLNNLLELRVLNRSFHILAGQAASQNIHSRAQEPIVSSLPFTTTSPTTRAHPHAFMEGRRLKRKKRKRSALPLRRTSPVPLQS